MYTWYSASSWITSEALYGTCSQGISQFYPHTHTLIRNRNELPLPFQLWVVLIYPPWRLGSGWLVMYWDRLRAWRQSPVPLLTGLSVAQLRWSRPTRYHYTKPPLFERWWWCWCRLSEFVRRASTSREPSATDVVGQWWCVGVSSSRQHTQTVSRDVLSAPPGRRRRATRQQVHRYSYLLTSFPGSSMVWYSQSRV